MGPDLAEALAQTADGLVAVDVFHRVVGWNQAASDLLGHSREEALGRPCCELLSWIDRHGNAVCGPDCLSVALGAAGRVVANQEVLAHTKAGRRLWLQVSTVVVPAEFRSQARLIHFLRGAVVTPGLEAALAHPAAPPAPAVPPDDQLSDREREVLSLLAEGIATRDLARRLGISPATVRNHVQHVLDKLGVHSRTAAVVLHLQGRG